MRLPASYPSPNAPSNHNTHTLPSPHLISHFPHPPPPWVQSALGKAVVVAMICVGVVLIPVQATAFYAELQARRVVRGECG